MSITIEQATELGQAHHRGELTRCPVCETPLKVQDRGAMGKSSRDLYLFCPRCQDGVEYNTSDVKDSPWSAEQQKAIIDAYWKHGSARCPNDRARIYFIASRSSNFVHAACPICGRSCEASG